MRPCAPFASTSSAQCLDDARHCARRLFGDCDDGGRRRGPRTHSEGHARTRDNSGAAKTGGVSQGGGTKPSVTLGDVEAIGQEALSVYAAAQLNATVHLRRTKLVKQDNRHDP